MPNQHIPLRRVYLMLSKNTIQDKWTVDPAKNLEILQVAELIDVAFITS